MEGPPRQQGRIVALVFAFKLPIYLTAVLYYRRASAHSASCPNMSDAQQGIPAVDPAAADQGQYASMAEGASLGAGSGAAIGGAVGAAGGPAGAVLGAAAGGLAGAVAGGTIASERGPTGAAVDMSKVAANAAGGPNSESDTRTGMGTPVMDPATGAPGPDINKAANKALGRQQ